MHVKSFLLKEFQGWSKVEILSLSAVFTVIFLNSVILKDSFVAVISAICGILYTILAGIGRVSCYLFGLSGSGCYCWLAFHSALYGNLALYLFYYIPMEIIGIFKWGKNLKKNSNEIVKTKLSNKERIFLFTICTLTSLIAIYIIKLTGGSKPFLDGITTVLSIAGMYLTVKRCIEQWVIWIIVNGLSFLMWANLVIHHGTKAYSTLIMWAFYFLAAIYFYLKWKKEIYNKI